MGPVSNLDGEKKKGKGQKVSSVRQGRGDGTVSMYDLEDVQDQQLR